MGNSDSETELKRKKEKKYKDKDSGDERKEKKDKGKEYKDKDKGKDKDKNKDKDKEEKKTKMDKDKGERKEKVDKEKEEKKEKKDKGKEEKGKEKDEKKKHKEGKYHDDKKDKPSHPSGSESHASSGPIDAHDGKAASHYKPSGAPVQSSQPGETPWFLREPDTGPVHQKPSQPDPNFPVPSPQYSDHPPSQQQPFRAVGEAGGIPPTQNVPPSGHRVPLSPNDHFPPPDRLGRPPATDSGGSIPVYIGSAIFPDSVHPCRIVPSLNTPCRVLYGGGEVEHHGRYDLLPVTQDMEWVPAKHGELPPGRRPVEGGYESNGNKLYHALGSVKGVYVPGKAGQHLVSRLSSFLRTEHRIIEISRGVQSFHSKGTNTTPKRITVSCE